MALDTVTRLANEYAYLERKNQTATAYGVIIKMRLFATRTELIATDLIRRCQLAARG